MKVRVRYRPKGPWIDQQKLTIGLGMPTDEAASDSDEHEASYVSKGQGRPRGSKNKRFLAPTGQSVSGSRPKRNLRRPDYTMRTNYDAAQSSAASSVKSSRSPSPTPREIYENLKPVFIEFPCRWRGCNASLMNLETLKKHLHIVHSAEARELLRCQWDKCGHLKTPVIFSKLSDVDSHVRERHIREVAWRLGDGIGSVVGGPVVPDFSVKPPLRLFRKEEPAEKLHQGKKSVDDDDTDM